MEIEERPFVLTIGGHDPSGGAGVTADIKTMEAIGVQGLSVCSSLTYQTEDSFEGLEWIDKKGIKKQLRPILERYKVSVAKIGIIENLKVLEWLVTSLKEYDNHMVIIWDPVVKTSTGYRLHKKVSQARLKKVLSHIDIITPNWKEIVELTGKKDAMSAARKLSQYTTVYLKGGHNDENIAVDYLLDDGNEMVLVPEYISGFEKHGSGCVFSSALASYLALSNPIDAACVAAKRYIAEYLDSSESLLGVHYQLS